MKYEIPLMEIIEFSNDDIATNLQASQVGSDGEIDFGSGFH